jgi:Tat protein translocase TatB subunit
MFGTLGGQEILLILILALIVFGPRKLPEMGKSLGRMLAEFRKASNDFRQTIETEVEADKLRAELAEQAARTQPSAAAPVEPVAAPGEPAGDVPPPAAAEGPAAEDLPPQMADGQAPAAPESHVAPDSGPDSTPAPAALHPPAESVSRE